MLKIQGKDGKSVKPSAPLIYGFLGKFREI